MFNLENSVAKWRKEMVRDGVKTPVPLEELENHLRDDIERQIKSGIKVQQAFTIASQKIGQGNALKNEFKKVDGKTDTLKQKFLSVYFIVFPLLYLALCTRRLLHMEMTFALRASGLTAMALTAFFICYSLRVHRHLPYIPNKNTRMTLQIVPLFLWMVCGCVFMNFILPRLNLDLAELVATMLWLMMPLALIAGLGYGLGDRARRQNKMIETEEKKYA